MTTHHRQMTSGYKVARHGGKIVGFKVLSEACIWMRAGVVNYRYCDNAYDCSTCAFDKGMRRALRSQQVRSQNKKAATNTASHWADNLQKRYTGMDRPCRHVLTGRVEPPKSCPLNYECHHCAFDQWVEDTEDLVQNDLRPACISVSGVPVAKDYYYHPGHTWVRFEHGGRLRIGMDGFASHLFGPLEEIELPSLGSDLKHTAVGWTIHRQEKSAGVQAPADGTVVAINPAIHDHPEMTHHDPYQHGWLMLVESKLPKRNLKHLMVGAEVFDWMEAEGRGLMELIGDDYVSLAATGGRLIEDLVGKVEALDWETLVRRFLHTAE